MMMMTMTMIEVSEDFFVAFLIAVAQRPTIKIGIQLTELRSIISFGEIILKKIPIETDRQQISAEFDFETSLKIISAEKSQKWVNTVAPKFVTLKSCIIQEVDLKNYAILPPSVPPLCFRFPPPPSQGPSSAGPGSAASLVWWLPWNDASNSSLIPPTRKCKYRLTGEAAGRGGPKGGWAGRGELGVRVYASAITRESAIV